MRRAPIERRTPLRRSGWLSRAAATALRRRDTGPDKRTRAQVSGRSGGMCERCGQQRAVHVHHRRPRRMGGTKDPLANRLANLGYLCLACHEWTEREPGQALCEGWRLHANEIPEAVPVLTRHGLVRLDNNGGWELA